MIDNIDKLTGLYTQKYFLSRLEEELARTRRYKRPLTLLLFEINYGYFVQDYNIRWAMVYTILKQFGALLLRQLRNVDLAGRYGGEMFSVLLPETPLEGGKVAGERIRKKVEEHSFIGDNVIETIRLAINGGLAAYPIHGKNAREIISSAHQGLLMARNEGGNKIVVCPHVLYDEMGNALLTIEPEISRVGEARPEPARIEAPVKSTESTKAKEEASSQEMIYTANASIAEPPPTDASNKEGLTLSTPKKLETPSTETESKQAG